MEPIQEEIELSTHLDIYRKLLEGVADSIDTSLQDEDWDELLKQLKVRQKYLEELFLVPISDAFQKKKMIELINVIFSKDSVDIAKIKVQMKEVDRKKKKFSQSQKAVKAYQNL